ncbi:hypothetical protein WEH80_14195 [Actinomycetes bacterium KLBMP 9759]
MRWCRRLAAGSVTAVLLCLWTGAGTAQALPAEDRARTSWEQHGRPDRLVIVRDRRIDLVSGGRLERQVPRPTGPVTLPALDRYLPNSWLTVDGGWALLTAAVVLTPRTTLDLGADVSGIRMLLLLGGALPQHAASIYTGGGTLVLRGTTVTSADPVAHEPMPPTAGRPFIEVSSRGRLDVVDATIAHLGTPPTTDVAGRAGVRFNPQSTGSVVRTTVRENSVGLELSRSERVRLEDVLVSASEADGVVLRGDRGTAMSGVRAERNGANGVLVTGESSDRPVAGLSTAGNKAFGVSVTRQDGPRIVGVATTADGAGGLRLSQTTGAVVTDFSATEQPVGVYTHVNSKDVVLDGLTTTGGRRGVVVEKSTHGLTVKRSTLTGARVSGVAVGGVGVALEGLVITSSRTAVRIERGSKDVAVTDLTIDSGRDGVVAGAGTSGVVIRNLDARDVASDAVRTFSPDARIVGGRIVGGATGIDAGAPTTITGTSISLVDEGVRSRSDAPVRAERISVDAVDAGITATAGSPFLLLDSTVHAREAVRGDVRQLGPSDVSLPPLDLLGAIGMPLVLLAVVLEQVHVLRQRNRRGNRYRPPPVVPARREQPA